MASESFTPDRLDRLLLQALRIDGRMPFARFARLMDVSEQTVARRYRRMHGAGLTRVIGLVDPAAVGESSWNVRIQVRPGAALTLAEALARRPDVGWVTLTSGGSELICSLRARTRDLRDELLVHRLPGTAQVIGLSALALLHRFDDTDGFVPGTERLGDDVRSAVLAAAPGGGARSADSRSATTVPGWDGLLRPVSLSAQDDAMLAELAADGRAPAVQLAAATGWTPIRANRRLDELVAAGLLYFDTDIAMRPFGFHEQAFLWLTIDPTHLLAAGGIAARMPEVTFAAASTGATNLMLSVACTDNAHLFRVVTDRLGSIPGIQGLEISPVLRRIKQAGTMMNGDRLAVGHVR